MYDIMLFNNVFYIVFSVSVWVNDMLLIRVDSNINKSREVIVLVMVNNNVCIKGCVGNLDVVCLDVFMFIWLFFMCLWVRNEGKNVFIRLMVSFCGIELINRLFLLVMFICDWLEKIKNINSMLNRVLIIVLIRVFVCM